MSGESFRESPPSSTDGRESGMATDGQMDRRTDMWQKSGRANELTDGRTDGRMDRQTDRRAERKSNVFEPPGRDLSSARIFLVKK